MTHTTPAAELTREEFAAAYLETFRAWMSYKPTEIGSVVYAERMADLYDAHPEWADELEAAAAPAAAGPRCPQCGATLNVLRGAHGHVVEVAAAAYNLRGAGVREARSMATVVTCPACDFAGKLADVR